MGSGVRVRVLGGGTPPQVLAEAPLPDPGIVAATALRLPGETEPRVIERPTWVLDPDGTWALELHARPPARSVLGWIDRLGGDWPDHVGIVAAALSIVGGVMALIAGWLGGVALLGRVVTNLDLATGLALFVAIDRLAGRPRTRVARTYWAMMPLPLAVMAGLALGELYPATFRAPPETWAALGRGVLDNGWELGATAATVLGAAVAVGRLLGIETALADRLRAVAGSVKKG